MFIILIKEDHALHYVNKMPVPAIVPIFQHKTPLPASQLYEKKPLYQNVTCMHIMPSYVLLNFKEKS